MKLFIYIVVVFVVVVFLYLKKMIMDSVLELISLLMLCNMYMLVMMRWNGVNERIIELFII